jgi:hypothetical protein
MCVFYFYLSLEYWIAFLVSNWLKLAESVIFDFFLFKSESRVYLLYTRYSHENPSFYVRNLVFHIFVTHMT